MSTSDSNQPNNRAALRRKAAAIAVTLALQELEAGGESGPVFSPVPPANEAWRAMSFARALPSRERIGRTGPFFPSK